MFSVENVNVSDEGHELHRPGWERASFPAYRDEDGLIVVEGWAKGPFGIFWREFIDDDAGRTAAAPLVHVKSLLRFGTFANPDGAAEAAERAEPLANWDALIASAASKADADDKITDALVEDWLKGYTFSDLCCPDGGVVHYRLTPEQERAQERVSALADELIRRGEGPKVLVA
jgi:hypothetical protein